MKTGADSKTAIPEVTSREDAAFLRGVLSDAAIRKVLEVREERLAAVVRDLIVRLLGVELRGSPGEVFLDAESGRFQNREIRRRDTRMKTKEAAGLPACALTEENARLIGCYAKVEGILRGEIPTPETVELFLTSTCNFSCAHCLFAERHDATGRAFMPGELARSVLSESREHGVRACEFSGGGEPMLHPDFLGLVELAAAQGFRVGIITNGSLLTRDGAAETIAQHATWLRVSLDATSHDEYRRVHGGAADFETTLAGIRALLDARRSRGSRLRVGVKFLLSKRTARSYRRAIRLGQELGVDSVSFKAVVRCPDELTRAEKRSLFGRISSAARREPSRPRISMSCRLEAGPPRCILTPLHALVDWDGSIYVCPFFVHRRERHLIGNAGEGGLFAHWGGAEHKARIAGIDASECNPDCPLARFEPVVDLIREQSDTFAFF